jgi:hypothetical protein
MTTRKFHGASFSEAIAHVSRLLQRTVVRATALDVAVTGPAAPSTTDLRRLRFDMSIALADLTPLLRELRTAPRGSLSQMNGVSAKDGLALGRGGSAWLRDIERELRRVESVRVQKKQNEREPPATVHRMAAELRAITQVLGLLRHEVPRRTPRGCKLRVKVELSSITHARFRA